MNVYILATTSSWLKSFILTITGILLGAHTGSAFVQEMINRS